MLSLRRVLRDADDNDTIRNEAANHLRANAVRELVDDCSAVLDREGELPRFRSFAAQHVGMVWLDAHSATPDLAAIAHSRLVALLTDRDIEVRREALLALVRGDDPDGLRTAAAWLDDPSPAADAGRDLAIRIAGERRQVEHHVSASWPPTVSPGSAPRRSSPSADSTTRIPVR